MARTRRDAPDGVHADAILNNLMEAVGWILRSSSRSSTRCGATVAVIGDVVADEFVYGRVARVSREAPVLILEYDSTEVVPGGGGNAANNVAALGGRAFWLVSSDATSRRRRLTAALQRASIPRCSCARPSPARRSRRASWPAAFTRPSSRSCASIARSNGAVDATTRARSSSGARSAAMRRTPCSCPTTGRASSRRRSCRKFARGAEARRASRFRSSSTSRYRLLDYRGLTACTPNESEVEQALGVRINDDRACSSGRAARCSSGRGCRRC